MIVKKSQKAKNKGITIGFLPDFSKYLFRDFPIASAYENSDLITKLTRFVSALITMENPARDLQANGLCKKLEKMSPKTDKEFFRKCDFPLGNIYYAAFGNNPYRIIFGVDSAQRIAYFLALDVRHCVR